MSYDWLINALRRTRPNRQLMFKAADALEEQRAVEDTLVEMMTKEHNGRLALEFRQKWISVEERLPEEKVPVQVTYLGYTDKQPRADMLACIYCGKWCYWDGEPCSYEECVVEITHWKPLPKPPKEGNK